MALLDHNIVVSSQTSADLTQTTQKKYKLYSSTTFCVLSAIFRDSITSDRVKDSAPLKLPTRYCLSPFLPLRLEHAFLKSGVSSTSPSRPRAELQPLPPTLRIKNA